MGLFKLNPSTFLESDVIEGWSSLIWTERYTDAGDFTLITPDIEKTRALIPEGSLLAIDGSREVMSVENSEIKKTEGKGEILTVTGRTFETILEARAVLNGVAPVTFIRTGATAALLLIQLNAITGASNSSDVIPNVTAGVTIGATLPSESYRFDQQSDVYSKMIEILRGDNLGIKNVRPLTSGALDIRIYDGKDRTSDNTAGNTKVILDYTRGDLVEGSYLFTNKDYRNIAYVNSPIGFRVVAAPGVSTAISGYARRVLHVDASDLTDPGSDTVATALNKRGKVELAAHNKRAFLDGKMSLSAKYKYGTDYNLGDKLTAKGRYKILQDMFVTEYIRSWAESGEFTSYPTLTQI